MATTPASFFSLPREVRIRIYVEQWKRHGPIQIARNGFVFQVRYQKAAKPPMTLPGPLAPTFQRQPLPSLFLTNSQIHFEAISELARCSSWRAIGDWRQFLPGSTTPWFTRAPQSPNYHLLQPSIARALDFTIALTNLSDLESNGDGMYRAATPCTTKVLSVYNPDRRFHRLFNTMDPGKPKVHHLSLTLTLQAVDPLSVPSRFTADLNALSVIASALPNLASMSVYLALSTVEPCMDVTVSWAHYPDIERNWVVQTVGAAVVNLAQLLLGEDVQRKGGFSSVGRYLWSYRFAKKV